MSLRERLTGFVKERAALGTGEPAMIDGGASFAYVFGKVLVVLLLVEALTGVALAAFYSPSTTDAWASVAYLEDQSTWGWLVRGLHHHGGGAIVVVAGLHLLQTAVAGAYKRPRELVWWLGVLLLMLTLAWAVTGLVLRWDQEGYWANRVEVGIAANTPIIGDQIRELALGGNEYGNLTLTRFYSLHVALLPAIVVLVTVLHVRLAKKHGVTAVRERKPAPRWPDQAIRDALAAAVTIAILLAWVVREHGAGLSAPADPSQAYDARPLWYFRWLFELRELAGSAEGIAALIAPAVVGGYLVVLPLLDRTPERAAKKRVVWLGGLAGLMALVAALTVMSFVRDAGDDELAERKVEAAKLADRARELARTYGVPVTGANDIYLTPPMTRARRLFAKLCSGCHAADSKDRVGPIIGPGHGNRAWIEAFLKTPNGDAFWGRTKLAEISAHIKKCEEAAEKAPAPPEPEGDKPTGNDKPAEEVKCPTDRAMPPTTLDAAELGELVEFVYGLSGAADTDRAKADKGKELFGDHCDSCHSFKDGEPGASGPGLAELGGRDYYLSFVSNPKSQLHMTADDMTHPVTGKTHPVSEMPAFRTELSLADREAIAIYLVWLRGATPADLAALGPP